MFFLLLLFRLTFLRKKGRCDKLRDFFIMLYCDSVNQLLYASLSGHVRGPCVIR